MARYTQHKKTHQYSDEFKSTAVQLSYMEGVLVKSVAESLDIHPFMLSRWRKEFREVKIVVDQRKKSLSVKGGKAELNKVKKLEKEVARLKMENDLLKKWQRFLAEQRKSDISS